MIVLYILGGLILLLLLIAAFSPNKYNLEKSIIIRSPQSEVLDRVGNLNHFKEWNPWQRMEPSATATISGEPKTAGHQYEWNGKKIGAGSLTIRDIDNRHIHFDLQFLRPWKSQARDNWLFEDWGTNETKVTWQNAGNLPFPMARLMWPMINKNLNHQFVEGLNNLKKLCEKS